MKIAKPILWLGLIVAAASAAQSPPPAPAQTIFPLADIQKRLASEDFATRCSVVRRRNLAKIPPDQLEPLAKRHQRGERPGSKGQPQRARVSAMDLYKLLHPPRLSLDIANATPAMVAARGSINKWGRNFVLTGANRTLGKPLALKVQWDQPFWEILRQLDQQNPLFLDPQVVSTPSRFTGLRIVYADRGPSHNLKVVEPFATEIQVYGTPALCASWTIEITSYCTTSRIRVVRATHRSRLTN